MSGLEVWLFRQRGTLENILERAGLIQVSKEEDTLTAGPELVKLFQDAKVPPMESIVPALVSLVNAHALDPCGFVSTNSMRIKAVSTLTGADMTREGIASLGPLIDRTAQTVKEEMGKAKQMVK